MGLAAPNRQHSVPNVRLELSGKTEFPGIREPCHLSTGMMVDERSSNFQIRTDIKSETSSHIVDVATVFWATHPGRQVLTRNCVSFPEDSGVPLEYP